MPARSRYFRSVAPGSSVVARDGTAVERRIAPTPLGPSDALLEAPKGSSDPSRIAFTAIEALVNSWFTYGAGSPLPLDQPVATAIVHAPTGNEGGVGIDEDLLFLRIVGLGGGKGKGEVENPLEKKGTTEENF